MQIGDQFLAQLVGRIQGHFNSIFGNEIALKDYGYLTVLDDVAEGEIICVVRVGNCSCQGNVASRCFASSIEGARRLFLNQDHLTSFVSRDTTKNKLGGAIRIIQVSAIISFSGYSEMSDEALMVFAAHGLGWINRTQISEIYEISQNPYIAKIVK